MSFWQDISSFLSYGLFLWYLLPGVRLKFLQADRRIMVTLPGSSAGTCLDGFCRAEVNTPAAEFAVVFPDGFSVHHINISGRANGCTGAAGRAFLIHREFPVILVDVGCKMRVCY